MGRNRPQADMLVPAMACSGNDAEGLDTGWGKILSDGLVGGLCGGIIALIGLLIVRPLLERKRRREEARRQAEAQQVAEQESVNEKQLEQLITRIQERNTPL